MSFQAMTWAVEQELPALQKIVLLMLANCTNQHTGRCDPSHDRLARECGMSKDSVKRAITELESKRLLAIRRQVQDGVNLPNQYTLKMGSSMGVVGADSTHGVGADSTDGGCSQPGGVGADSTTKQEVITRKKLSLSSDSKFEEAWRAYPKREGGNSKQAALKAWTARVREGVDPEILMAATQAYAVAMQKAGNAGSRYVRQAATFFGPDRHFEEFSKSADALAGLFASSNDTPWWLRAGFEKEWQATNEGCSERYAHLWRNGKRVAPGATA